MDVMVKTYRAALAEEEQQELRNFRYSSSATAVAENANSVANYVFAFWAVQQWANPIYRPARLAQSAV